MNYILEKVKVFTMGLHISHQTHAEILGQLLNIIFIFEILVAFILNSDVTFEC